jgi:RNA polymerase sigma-70 factor (ECF subfamily)
MAERTKLLGETRAPSDEAHGVAENTASHGPDAALLQRAAEGDRQAMRQLVTALAPVIRRSVQGVLSRVRRRVHGQDAVQEVEDTTQSVLLLLFADRARVLLEWEPARNPSLERFVELRTRRETVSLLRSRRRSPPTEDPTPYENHGPEAQVITRATVEALAQAVRDRLSPRGAQLFDMMCINDMPVEEICAATGFKPDAIDAWRGRISRVVREILAEHARNLSSGQLKP